MAHGGTKYSNVTFRLATPADYEGVMDIDRNVYGGNDYMPTLYNKYITDSRRFSFVAEIEERIVGFEMFTLIDGDASLIVMAGRVHPDFRQRGLLTALEMFSVSKVVERHPNIKRILATTLLKQQTEKKPANSDVRFKIIMQRPVISRVMTARDIQNVMTAHLVAKMSRDFPLDEVHHVTSSVALETLTEKIDERKFIPEGVWMVNCEPYGACASSYKMILEDSTCFATHYSGKPHCCMALSFGTAVTVPLGLRYRLDFYCDRDVVDERLVIAHIWKHILYLNQFKKMGTISFGVLLPSGEITAAIETYFDRELLMMTSDVYKGVLVVVEQKFETFSHPKL